MKTANMDSTRIGIVVLVIGIVAPFASGQNATPKYDSYESGAYDATDLQARFEALEKKYSAITDTDLRAKLELAYEDLRAVYESGEAEEAGRILSYMESIAGDADGSDEMRSKRAEELADSPEGRALRDKLLAAQHAKDLVAIREVVVEMIAYLGEYAGVPEVHDQYRPVPKEAQKPTREEASQSMQSYLEFFEDWATWRIGEDPGEVTHMLRSPASVVVGMVAAYRAGLEPQDELLATAKEHADYLLWTQQQAEVGLFPFPARRGITEGVFGIAHRALERAEKEGRLDEVVRNGWAIEDERMDDGGLQFDNGLCGVAMLELYDVTQDEKYLSAAIRAADWTITRPIVPNWNYNSFSVYLLAETYRATNDKKYLDAAKEKARLGIYPGQLTEGPRTGRWVDPHNARAVYHFIMVRSMVSLLAAMDESDPDREQLLTVLRRALPARTAEIATKGVNSTESAFEALALLPERVPNHQELIGDFEQDAALDAMGRYFHHALTTTGEPAVEPGAWARYLEAVLPPKS